MFRSGSRTRDRQISNLLLYPLSYPVVDEPDSNRRPAACTAALPLSYRPLAKHLLPASGIRHGNAARTGRVLEPAPLDAVRPMLRIGASSKAPIPCTTPHPSAARAQHPGTALARLSAMSPSQQAVRARMLRDSGPSCRMKNLRLRTRKKKERPRHGVRGRSRSSEIGVTDLREEDQSMGWASRASRASSRAHGPAPRSARAS